MGPTFVLLVNFLVLCGAVLVFMLFLAYTSPNRGFTKKNSGDPKKSGARASKTAVFFIRFQPHAGPMEGGTHVIVTGRDFAGGHGYKCRFGGKEVVGVFRFASGTLAPQRKNVVGANVRGVGSGGGGRWKTRGNLMCVTTGGGAWSGALWDQHQWA